ncbi:MAG TPA: ribbon-helix-helix protein, CopG family [Candidatus Limnocylindria bacterium]|nr:ribbon-helix-helix protein, CopG family [Candidatus Limnocylindria bacterium]
MVATRTQVYLTKEQRRALEARRQREGKTLAAVIRDAVDAYIAADVADRQAILDRTFGSIPDFEVPSRDEWEERAKRLGH